MDDFNAYWRHKKNRKKETLDMNKTHDKNSEN